MSFYSSKTPSFLNPTGGARSAWTELPFISFIHLFIYCPESNCRRDEIPQVLTDEGIILTDGGIYVLLQIYYLLKRQLGTRNYFFFF